MRIDPRWLKKILSLLRHIPDAVEGAQRVWDVFFGRGKRDIAVVPPEEERSPTGSQGDEERIAQCIRALRKHVQVINRNSNVLSEHEHIIEELAKQGKERAEVLDKLCWLVKIALLVSVVSLVIAVVAVLVTLL